MGEVCQLRLRLWSLPIQYESETTFFRPGECTRLLCAGNKPRASWLGRLFDGGQNEQSNNHHRSRFDTALGRRPGRQTRTCENDPSGGILRIDFVEAEEELEEISWSEFFRIFDDNDLAFLHRGETTAGGISRIDRFIDCNS